MSPMDQKLKNRSHLRFELMNMALGTTALTVTCPDCGAESFLAVETKPLEIWLTTRALIQEVLPELSDFQREQLITGYCQACWDKMWAYLEEEED